MSSKVVDMVALEKADIANRTGDGRAGQQPLKAEGGASRGQLRRPRLLS